MESNSCGRKLSLERGAHSLERGDIRCRFLKVGHRVLGRAAPSAGSTGLGELLLCAQHLQR